MIWSEALERSTRIAPTSSGEVEGHPGQAEPDFKIPKIRFFKNQGK